MTTVYPTTSPEEAFRAATAKFATILEFWQTEAAMSASHVDIEAGLDQQGRELMREVYQGQLRLRSGLEQRVEVRGREGVRRGSTRLSQRPLGSRFGLVTVFRFAYQQPGVEGRHPMDGILNLPPTLYSYGVCEMTAEAAATCSFEAASEAVRKRTGLEIGKRQLEEIARSAATDFEAFYAQCTQEPESSTDLLVLSFDGKGIVMRKQDLRLATRIAAEQEVLKVEKRRSKGEKKNRKRMAEVAAVYSLSPYARTASDVLYGPANDDAGKKPRPYNKTVWASVRDDMRKVIRRTFEEALRRDPDRRRRWVVLVDGNADQLRHIKAAARRVSVKVTIVLDLMHVIEYLWKAARKFFAEGDSKASRWVTRQLGSLLDGRSGGEVARSIRRLAKQRGVSLEGKKNDVADCIRYLKNHTRYMHYDRALADGLPIATGVVEGACRHLVARRMDAARWSVNGAEAVLRLRALLLNGDLDAYWAFHMDQERRRNHASHYEGQLIPFPFLRDKRTATLLKAA